MTQARVRLSDFNDIPDMSLTDEEIHAQIARENAPPDSWTPINLADLADKPPVQPTLGNTGLVYPGKRHVFSGPQESAKTLAAYTIAILVIRQGHTVIIIDFEMGQWEARDRLRELGCTQDELAGIRYIEPHEPATQERINTLVELGPALVIVDAAAGAYDIQGLDDNKRSDVERFTRIYVQEFWRAEIATIVLDHVVKNLDNRGAYAIGSERKTGGTDVHLGFSTVVPIKRGTEGIYKITTHKDRGGYLQRGRLADMHITSDLDTHQMTVEFREAEHHDETDPWKPTIYMERVSRELQKHSEARSQKQVEDAVEGRATYTRQALEHLVDEGYISIEIGPRNAKMYVSIKPYTKPDDDLVPTSSHLVPDEVVPPRPTSSPPYRGTSVARDDNDEVTSSREIDVQIDVHDPAVQAQLDGYDSDIPF